MQPSNEIIDLFSDDNSLSSDDPMDIDSSDYAFSDYAFGHDATDEDWFLPLTEDEETDYSLFSFAPLESLYGHDSHGNCLGMSMYHPPNGDSPYCLLCTRVWTHATCPCWVCSV